MPTDSFTGKEIPKGRAMMYVKKDGTIYWFADKKSEKNLLKLHRNPSKTKWTNFYHKEKEIKAKSKEPTKKGAKKGK
ncbi:MAG TPA: 50S ribosomal protein L24e [Candidatus Diapherotrites archaeon]|uniref:50S ribosomal protein L24e n=1 Tax=Candidatus Iainarchaeum sp. TaxID=3101447 RepID=A0A7J4IZC7_9ARCH|nr:50S ribosomal protein L24e [Candidatus Diapherotrites archaeon]